MQHLASPSKGLPIFLLLRFWLSGTLTFSRHQPTITSYTMDDEVPYIEHSRFKAGLPHGRFRVVINPALARPYVVQRTYLNAVLIACIAAGAGLAMAGSGLLGLVVCALGVIASRLARHQAAKVVLHLAQQHPQVYAEVTTNGVMEVRHAGS